jgi:hypothetical protein
MPCKTVGSAYASSNLAPATPARRGPSPAETRCRASLVVSGRPRRSTAPYGLPRPKPAKFSGLCGVPDASPRLAPVAHGCTWCRARIKAAASASLHGPPAARRTQRLPYQTSPADKGTRRRPGATRRSPSCGRPLHEVGAIEGSVTSYVSPGPPISGLQPQTADRSDPRPVARLALATAPHVQDRQGRAFYPVRDC